MVLITYEDVLKTYKSREAGIKALAKYFSWFPIKRNKILAGIVADLIGDGHAQKPPMWRMDYTSSSIKELNRFSNTIYSQFGIKGKIRPCNTNKFGKTYNLGLNSKQLGRALSLCGVPQGAKVMKKFSVPSWILEDKELFGSFVKRLFDCEGNVDVSSKAIELRMSKEISIINSGIIFFEEIREKLKGYYDIDTNNIFLGGKNIRKDKKITQEVRLKIKRKDSVKKYFELIGFDTEEKQKKLEKIILTWIR